MTTNKVCGKGKCKFTDEFCASGDCPYDTENVANNVAQRNSQDLTEQWKKGELVQEDYYLKDNKYTFIDYFNGVSFEETCDFEIKEVLAEVPSYEEWQPFTDPYFRGLTTKDIAELAKKSIRLTTQHCKDNEEIEILREQLDLKNDMVDKLIRENERLKKWCEEFNALNVAEENQNLKELLKACRDGLEKIKHIGETKKLGAVYQVAERTLAKIDEVLK